MKFFSKSDYKNSKLIKRLSSLAVIFFFSFSFIAISYKTVHAGLFSLLNTLLTGEQASAKSVPKIAINSQNMSLPVVAVNIDPNPDKNFEVIPVRGETLVADIAESNASFVEYSPNISVYTVRAGDTISGVAKMFNVSVNTILWANNLNSKSVLKAGQSLTILPVTGIKYTVEKNDTILGIANKYQADVNEIYSYNDLDSDSKIFVGQKIIIPDAEMGSVVAVSTRPVVRALNGMIVPEDPVTVNIKSLPSYSGYYSCPAVGVLTQALHGRNAVDIAGPIGTSLRASADGTVTISKSNGTWNGGYGNFVVISHDNGTQTLYGHMQKTTVNAGERVGKGEIIGYIGISGLTTGPHVHFEVRGAKNPFVNTSCN
jgi:LysM repeat protein